MQFIKKQDHHVSAFCLAFFNGGLLRHLLLYVQGLFLWYVQNKKSSSVSHRDRNSKRQK